MSAAFPATIRLSLSELARRGGQTGMHADGWGVAFHDGTDVRLLREPNAASSSACADVLKTLEIRSPIVIAHIRKATLGARALRNTQPFVRELSGRVHSFAHNGMLHSVATACSLGGERFHPVGETDSEYAFCMLLHRLESLWKSDAAPPLAARAEAVRAFAADISPLGPANFMYSDADALFAHAHRRTQLDGEIRAPGLHLLRRHCVYTGAEHAEGEAPFEVRDYHPEQSVSLLASVPLSEEHWVPLPEGELLVLRDGDVVFGPKE